MNPMIARLPSLVALVLVTSAIHLHAQEDKTRIRVKMGMEGDGDARMFPVSLVKPAPNSILMHRDDRRGPDASKATGGRLDLYDRAKLGFLRTQPVVEKFTNGAKVDVEGVVVFGGRTLVIARNGGAASTALHVQILEPSITKMPAPYEPLCSWSVPFRTNAAPTERPGSFAFHFSPDSAFLLLRSPVLQNAQGQGMVLLAVLSKDLSVSWQSVVPAPEKMVRTDVLDAMVDVQGRAYLVLRNRANRSDVFEEKPTIAVTCLRVHGDTVVDLKVAMPKEVFVTQALLRATSKETIVLAGVYGKVEGQGIVAVGDFLVPMTVGNVEVPVPQMMLYPKEGSLVNEGEPPAVPGQKFVEKDIERIETGVRLLDLLPRKGGGYYLVKELFFLENYFDLKDKRTKTRYIHGPVQASALDKNGAVQWNTLFKRWYQSDSPMFGDVLCGEYMDQLFLFLQDTEQMAALRKAGGKITTGLNDGPYTAYVTFDPQGAYKIKPVLKSDNESGYVCGQRLIRLGKDEYYTFGAEKPTGGRFLPVRIDMAQDAK